MDSVQAKSQRKGCRHLGTNVKRRVFSLIKTLTSDSPIYILDVTQVERLIVY